MKKLKKKEQNKERIMQAKLQIERVVFQLNMILARQEIFLNNNRNIKNNPDIQDISNYQDIVNKIDTEKILKFMLVLEKDFGSMEKVLDEYLYALQIGIDFEMYLTNKKAYEKKKTTKSIGINIQSIITVAKIEEKMLYTIEKQRKDENKFSDVLSNEEQSSIQQIPMIDVQVVKPKNPLEDVMKEINAIKNQSYNMPNIENQERMGKNNEPFTR